MTDGQPQLLATQCSTCVFRAGNLMHLRPGALADIIRRNRSQGTVLICHQTLSYGAHPELGEAVCRGYYDRYREESQVIQVIERLGGFALLQPPGSAPAADVPTTADVIGVIARIGAIPGPEE